MSMSDAKFLSPEHREGKDLKSPPHFSYISFQPAIFAEATLFVHCTGGEAGKTRQVKKEAP